MVTLVRSIVLAALALGALGACRSAPADADAAAPAEDAPALPALRAALPALRAELLERVEVDQEARRRWLADRAGVDLAEVDLGAVDRENTAWLRAVVDEHGWPGRSLVGEDGAHAAWLLVQHADRDPAFQRRCLELMRAAPEGEVGPTELAYLTDRVRVGEGRPQVYGTQWYQLEGELVPRPIEDEAEVDRRRREVGLGTLEEYGEQMRSMIGGS